MSKENTQSKDKTTATAKLGFFALVTVVVSSMLGGGVYSLPQNTAQSSAAGPVIIAWLIVGLGVYFIANSFRILSDIRPDLKAGVYMYAREGFGKFIGFITAYALLVESLPDIVVVEGEHVVENAERHGYRLALDVDCTYQ